MKNLKKYKSILVLSLFLAGTATLATSCSENKTVERDDMDNRDQSESKILVVDNNDATVFLMEVAEMQMEEINLGKLAQQNGTSTSVKELGTMIEEDHVKILSELTILAQSKSVSIPTTISEDAQDDYDDLLEKTGTDFEKEYSSMMVERQEDVIEKFEKASTDSNDPEIRAWASEKLPILRTHLVRAKACKEEVEKSE